MRDEEPIIKNHLVFRLRLRPPLCLFSQGHVVEALEVKCACSSAHACEEGLWACCLLEASKEGDWLPSARSSINRIGGWVQESTGKRAFESDLHVQLALFCPREIFS